MTAEFSHDTVMLIFTRDRERCFRCGKACAPWERGRSWSVHHRQPRGMGSTMRPQVSGAANGILLCGDGVQGCHGWVESHRETARALGYLVPLNGVAMPEQVPIMRADQSWWRLSDTGGIEQAFVGGDDAA